MNEKFEKLLEKIITYTLIGFIFVGLGYGWRMIHEKKSETKNKIVVIEKCRDY